MAQKVLDRGFAMNIAICSLATVLFNALKYFLWNSLPFYLQGENLVDWLDGTKNNVEQGILLLILQKCALIYYLRAARNRTASSHSRLIEIDAEGNLMKSTFGGSPNFTTIRQMFHQSLVQLFQNIQLQHWCNGEGSVSVLDIFYQHEEKWDNCFAFSFRFMIYDLSKKRGFYWRAPMIKSLIANQLYETYMTTYYLTSANSVSMVTSGSISSKSGSMPWRIPGRTFQKEAMSFFTILKIRVSGSWSRQARSINA